MIGPRLTSGTTQSCGCLRGENLKIHGLRSHPLYNAWKAMRSRCRNPNHVAFPNYGGRGIAVCDRWDDFSIFLADMGEKPGPEYSIERIDNDGPYSPENCRWATRSEQRANQRPLSRKTHCKHGHPFDEVNTHILPDGSRRCLACQQRRDRARTNR